MAEAPASEPLTSGDSEASPIEIGEPSPKRRKESKDASDKLEDRLGGILCCAVCLELPQATVYQCINGHLMCELCFTHLLADAALRRESANCPNCRIEISKSTASRNLAVEKTVSELPFECKFCSHTLPKHALPHHENAICENRPYKFSQIIIEKANPSFPYNMVKIMCAIQAFLFAALGRLIFVSAPAHAHSKRRVFRRLVGCQYAIIGCSWQGKACEAKAHEDVCAFPAKPASEIIELLKEKEKKAKENSIVSKQIYELLTYEYITFTNLQLRPYRSAEVSFYYESCRFCVFNQQWLVKAYVNTNQRDPTQSAQREITYQLLLKSSSLYASVTNWVVVPEPHGDLRLRIEVHAFSFTEQNNESPRIPLPLEDPNDTNRLLSDRGINFRLIMFQA